MAPEWVPEIDENNNLILHAEEGDNAGTLWNFFGRDDNIFGYTESEVENLYDDMTRTDFLEGEQYVFLGQENVISKTNKLLKNLQLTGSDSNTTNCFECASEIAVGNVPVLSPQEKYFDPLYMKYVRRAHEYRFEDAGSVGNMVFGESTTTFGGGLFPKVKHEATYMGTDSGGNSYYFSKNGYLPQADFGIFQFSQLKALYGSPMGFGNNESGFYNLNN